VSQAYTLYRDGEEVEVSWLEKKFDDLRRFLSACRQTDWVHYFHGNGPWESVSKEFTGFRKLQSSRTAVGTWTICIKGGIRLSTGAFYYRNIAVSGEGNGSDLLSERTWSEFVRRKVSGAEKVLDLYQRLDCTCRVGFHRRCPHHYTTQN
jgi:hypothetical protein